MTKKIKILTISDHPIHALSGVGTQTRYIIESLLRSEKYKVISLGGAMRHPDYNPTQTEEFGEDWTVFPVDGYGTHEMIRSILRAEKPDILWFMTDPRFYGWLWEIEDEIRSVVPMVYYHVWDNHPPPKYNKEFYDSNDVIVAISKLTHDIVKEVSPDIENIYLPHAVDSNVFKKVPDEELNLFKEEHGFNDTFTFFWNNRNARRKQSGSLIFWFKEFLDEIGRGNARLIMHTDPKDPHGQDLNRIIKALDIDDGSIMISDKKIPPEALALIYNSSDCTVNISDAEGFGLSTLESLSCGTPIVVNMTGGLQEQVTNGEDWFGIGLNPASQAIIGSQEVPYIYEDRLAKKDVIAAFKKMYNMTKEERDEMGRKGMEHVRENYNFDKYGEKWAEIFENIYENRGSWENRKNHKRWHFMEIK